MRLAREQSKQVCKSEVAHLKVYQRVVPTAVVCSPSFKSLTPKFTCGASKNI